MLMWFEGKILDICFVKMCQYKIPLSVAALMHRKSASTLVSHDSCSAVVSSRRYLVHFNMCQKFEFGVLVCCGGPNCPVRIERNSLPLLCSVQSVHSECVHSNAYN